MSLSTAQVRVLVVDDHPLLGEGVTAVLVLKGRVFEPSVALQIADYAGEPTPTRREIEVLQLVAGGNSNKLIARTLAVSEETVKTHVRNLIAKLRARDRTHAVTLGVRRGIIQL